MCVCIYYNPALYQYGNTCSEPTPYKVVYITAIVLTTAAYSVYIYMCVYIYVCVCVCVKAILWKDASGWTETFCGYFDYSEAADIYIAEYPLCYVVSFECIVI